MFLVQFCGGWDRTLTVLFIFFFVPNICTIEFQLTDNLIKQKAELKRTERQKMDRQTIWRQTDWQQHWQHVLFSGSLWCSPQVATDGSRTPVRAVLAICREMCALPPVRPAQVGYEHDTAQDRVPRGRGIPWKWQYFWGTVTNTFWRWTDKLDANWSGERRRSLLTIHCGHGLKRLKKDFDIVSVNYVLLGTLRPNVRKGLFHFPDVEATGQLGAVVLVTTYYWQNKRLTHKWQTDGGHGGSNDWLIYNWQTNRTTLQQMIFWIKNFFEWSKYFFVLSK